MEQRFIYTAQTKNRSKIEYIQSLKYASRIVLDLGLTCIRYSQVERIPRYTPEHRENDAEHSVMLAIIATELADMLRPGRIDAGMISRFSVVHDMVEIIVGDTPTFHTSEAMLAQKASMERDALESLLTILPPHTSTIVERYEAQDTDEAIWTKAVDKLLAIIVDIEGCGAQVMNEDYGVHSLDELQTCHSRLIDSFIRRFGEPCPELVPLYIELCEEFERRFEATISSALH